MIRGIKGIIFDLDGTLLDTRLDLSHSVNYSLRMTNEKEVLLEDVVRNTGNGIRRLVYDSLGNKEKIEEALSYFNDYYSNHLMDYTKPYDGIIVLLNSLKQKGYKLAVVSNKKDELVQRLINHFFPDIFDYITGAKKNYKLKPEKDLIDLTLNNLNIKNDECVYIGDSLVDLNTALNSNLKHIICTYGFKEKKELEKYKIKLLVCKPLDVLNYL